MGAMGSDAAIEAADVVLMDDDPAKISLAMKISRKCMHIVYQNIVFALSVKAIFLLLGAFGIANHVVGCFCRRWRYDSCRAERHAYADC